MNRGEVFGRIYEEHRQVVHAYFLGRTGDRQAALDLVQETFLRVWRRLPELCGLSPERQRAWIFTVAHNLVIDSYRNHASRRATNEALRRTARTDTSAGDDPEERAELTERLGQLDRAIRELPEPLRTVLTMHAMTGLTSRQIAAVLGEPAGTIRYRLSLARRRLATALGLSEERDHDRT